MDIITQKCKTTTTLMDFPSYIQLYPTIRCTQNCSFCFNQNILDSASYSDMNAEKASTLCDILTKTAISEIDILGGEPLLIPWIKDFVTHLTESGTTINISTNGSLPHVVQKFIDIDTSFLNIGFSVHGFIRTHNSLTQSDNFLKTTKGIQHLLLAGKNPIVKSLLTKENMNEILDLVLYLKELGVRKYYLMHEDIIGRKIYQNCISFPEFWDFYSKLKATTGNKLDIGFVAASGFVSESKDTTGRCNAGIKKIAIMPDGSAFPCNLFAGFTEFCLGNIFKDGIEQIWRSPKLKPFRKNFTKNRCKINNCEHYFICKGGCPAHSYYFYGSLDSADPRCAKGIF
ncbi:MAG: radical SAM protein [Nitrospirota bacterium]